MNPSIVSSVAEFPANGKVLAWARDLRQLSISDAAARLGIPAEELLMYERGQKAPNRGFLRHMADKYRINYASLLMDEPLPPAHKVRDFRSASHSLSVAAILAIEEVEESLESFGEFAEEDRKVVAPLNIGKASLSDDPEVVAAQERHRFGIEIAEQQTWSNAAAARRQWRRRVEERGVFTYMIPMPDSELSGFSIMRGELAAICINDKQLTEGRKIFTLFHEYAHLLLRQGGISDENNKNRTEKFCNQFAASFLMPLDALVSAIGNVKTPHEFSDAQIKRLATSFRVSGRAVAMRLQETGLAPADFYARSTGGWDAPVERPQKKSAGQPNHLVLRLKRLGDLHTTTVLRAAKRKVINTFDAAALTGIAPRTITRLQQSV